jgi:SulP family sulfate permease
VAVMIMVSISTFDWSSFRNIRSHPWPSSVVMLATVIVVVVTRDLSKGVLVGVLLSGVFFAGKVARMFSVTSVVSPDGKSLTYFVTGQVFFASASGLVDAIDYQDVPTNVCIDVGGAQFWDVSSISALDDIVLKLRRHAAIVEVVGLDHGSASMVERYATHHRVDAPALNSTH